MERWILLVCTGLAVACPAAVGVWGEDPAMVALTFVGSFAAAVVGWLGLSRPGDRLKQGDGPNPRDLQ
jgi:hypothetical protein